METKTISECCNVEARLSNTADDLIGLSRFGYTDSFDKDRTALGSVAYSCFETDAEIDELGYFCRHCRETVAKAWRDHIATAKRQPITPDDLRDAHNALSHLIWYNRCYRAIVAEEFEGMDAESIQRLQKVAADVEKCMGKQNLRKLGTDRVNFLYGRISAFRDLQGNGDLGLDT